MDLMELFGMASCDLEPKPKFREFVKQRIAAGLCLQCDMPANKSRGLCRHHHHRFRMDRLDRPKNKRKTFEDDMILNAKILAPAQGKRRVVTAKAG